MREKLARTERAAERHAAVRLRREASEAARAALIRSRRTKCLTCAAAIEYSGMGIPRRYCGEACEKAGETWKRSKRVAKAARKARLRGAECESFDPLEVLSRDGWRCHLCGCATPRRHRGTTHPRAPELDHIVPLARGGPHTKANTACACRTCNIAKGDSLVGQARLFG